MNERLSAALSQRNVDREQRRLLCSLRHDLLSFRDRLDAAQTLFDANDYRLAALWYASALRIAGEERAPAIGYLLGNALRMIRHQRAAAQVLEGVCAALPQWGDPAHSLAWLYRNTGQVAKAADVLERWLGATSSTTREVRLVAGFMLDMGLADRAQGLLARATIPAGPGT